jgi:hypothetical protein
MAAKANLRIDQGTDFSTVINLTDDDGEPIDLEFYIGKGQIRKYYTSTTAVDFDVDIFPETGEVRLSLGANTSNNMEFGRYVYDVELTDGITGLISRVIEGIVTITPGVTRDH